MQNHIVELDHWTKLPLNARNWEVVIGDSILDFGFWILDCFCHLQSKI
jgi:hypothetical protein